MPALKTPPDRIAPTRHNPLSHRTHNVMRNAPFTTLFTNWTALLRDPPRTMFVQAFSHCATYVAVAYPPFPARISVPPDISPRPWLMGRRLRRRHLGKPLTNVIEKGKD